MKCIRLALALLLVGLLQANSLISSLRAQQLGGLLFVTVADVTDTQEEDRLVNALTKAGYSCLPMPDTSGNGVVHVQVGPYTTQAQADAARSRLIAAGYKLPGAGTAVPPSGLTAQQRDLEAQALVNLSGGSGGVAPPPSNGNDLEAQALAHLNGGAPSAPAATGGDLEAQALQALQSNTQQAEVERLHQEELAAARAQQQAQEAQAAAEQAASAPAQQSTAATFLNGLSAVLGQATNQMAAQNAQTNANIAAQQAQLAQIQQAQQQRARQQLEQQQRAQQQVAQQAAAAQQAAHSQQASATAMGVGQVSNGTRLCPNGKYTDDHGCDCRLYSANANGYCPSGSSAVGAAAQTSASSPRALSGPVASSPAASAPAVSAPRQTAPNGSVFSYPSPQPNTGGQFGPSTGIAAPPSCIYLSATVPCLSPSTWQEIQSAPVSITPPTNAPTGPPRVYYIVNSDIPPGPGVVWCPRTGHIETGYYTANDVWIGQQSPCTVGFHVRVTWPALPGSDGTQYASASGSSASGSSGPGSGNGSATGSGNGSGSGGSGTVSDTVTPLCSTVVVEWVQDTTFPNKQDLFLHNYCAQELSVKWILGNEIPSLSSLAAFARRNSLHGVRPGQDNHVSVYACPMDHPVAVDAKGIEVYGQNQPYSCKKGNPPHDALTPYQ